MCIKSTNYDTAYTASLYNYMYDLIIVIYYL